MIEADDLEVSFGEHPVLRGVSIDVEEGEIVTVVGPSGCGKTTLLRTIGGLRDPSGGRVRVADRSPADARRDARIGFLFQDHALLPWKTAIENVVFLRGMAGKNPDREGARTLLERVGLGADATKRPGELSGGMKGRVALARAMHLGAPVLLMDEPFSSLDELTREELNALFLEIHRDRRQTALFETHSVPEAVFLADRCVVLGSSGSVVDRLSIDLPRPRNAETLTAGPYQERVADVRDALFESR